MQVRYFFVMMLFFTAALVNAQGVLRGTVAENASNSPLSNVFIRDINSKQLALSDGGGSFEIKTETGHSLIFDCPGYVSDTLYVINMEPKRIHLLVKTIALREVSIKAGRPSFDPHTEYPQVYEKSKVYILSPTTWFSKEGKDARRLKKYFAHEAEEEHVDAVFNMTYVGSIVPLKGQQLEDFMVMYRPTYAFVKSNNGESMAAYINDCYKKYQALPPDKRTLTRITNQTIQNN
jgi:hypothetical protein